jgi:hypothetical protein
LKLDNQKTGKNEVTRQVNPTGSSHKKAAKLTKSNKDKKYKSRPRPNQVMSGV